MKSVQLKMLLIVQGMILGFVAHSIAGTEIGNGGDAYLCKDNAFVRLIELLDYNEGSRLRGIQRSLGDPSLDPMIKVELALARLERLDQSRAQRYRERVKTFFDDALFIQADLTQIPDYGYIPLEPGCSIVQVAMQRKRQYQEDKTFLISKEYWVFMDNDSRAGLILHEIIYEEFISLGATDSVDVRYFNSVISSERLNGMTQNEYVELLNTLRVDRTKMHTSVGGLEYVLDGLLFFSDGGIKKGTLFDSGKLTVGRAQYDVGKDTLLAFYRGGGVYEASLYPAHPLIPFVFPVEGKGVQAVGGYPMLVSFYPDGSLQMAPVPGYYRTFDGLLHFPLGIYIHQFIPVGLYPNGRIKYGTVDVSSEPQTIQLTTADGTKKTFENGDPLLFDEMGRVIRKLDGKWSDVICFGTSPDSSGEVFGVSLSSNENAGKMSFKVFREGHGEHTILKTVELPDSSSSHSDRDSWTSSDFSFRYNSGASLHPDREGLYFFEGSMYFEWDGQNITEDLACRWRRPDEER